jgi:ferric-dicitrate binding protein FerR (iron transport regulator)
MDDKNCEVFSESLALSSAGIPAAADLREHLEVCTVCRQRAAEQQALITALDADYAAQFDPKASFGSEQTLALLREKIKPRKPAPKDIRKSKNPMRKILFWPAALSAAAALFLLVFLFSQSFRREQTTTSNVTISSAPLAWIIQDGSPNAEPTPLAPGREFVPDKDASLLLADGSRVRLRSTGCLEITTEREVKMRSGDAAFFIATKPGKKPFIVRGPVGSARVLGTAFTYSVDESRERVCVASGTVAFKGAQGEELMLSAGQAAEISAEVAVDWRVSGPEPTDFGSFLWLAGTPPQTLTLDACLVKVFFETRDKAEAVLQMRLTNQAERPRKIMPFHPLSVNWGVETVRLEKDDEIGERLWRKAGCFSRLSPQALSLLTKDGEIKPQEPSRDPLILNAGETYLLEWRMALPGKQPCRWLVRPHYWAFPSDASGGAEDAWGLLLRGNHVSIAAEEEHSSSH